MNPPIESVQCCKGAVAQCENSILIARPTLVLPVGEERIRMVLHLAQLQPAERVLHRSRRQSAKVSDSTKRRHVLGTAIVGLKKRPQLQLKVQRHFDVTTVWHAPPRTQPDLGTGSLSARGCHAGWGGLSRRLEPPQPIIEGLEQS